MSEPSLDTAQPEGLPPAYTPRDGNSPNSHAPIYNELSSSPLPFRSADYVNEQKIHLLLCASGSVATIKIPAICKALSKYYDRLSIRLILTTSAIQFLQGQSEEQPSLHTVGNIPGVDGIYTDADEWAHPWSRSGPAGSPPILHIELRKWADLMVIAPLSANTMAKIVAGMSDNLITSVIRAWDSDARVDGLRSYFKDLEQKRLSKENGFQQKGVWELMKTKKVLLCPAMNTAMWRQPITSKHIKKLEKETFKGHIEVLEPMSKALACGDVGDGAMIDWKELVWILKLRCSLEPLRKEEGIWVDERKYRGYAGTS